MIVYKVLSVTDLNKRNEIKLVGKSVIDYKNTIAILDFI